MTAKQSITFAILFCFALPAFSQPQLSTEAAQEYAQPDQKVDETDPSDAEIQRQEQTDAVEQLREIQQSLDEKRAERKAIREKLKTVSETEVEAVEADLASLNSEIELLEKTFEQIAIGGIDLSVFGIKDEKFDWREELVLVVKPLIENVKGLTEKPRKIESLRRVIEEKSAAKETSQDALKSIEKLQEKAESDEVIDKLQRLEREWQSRVEDLDREIQLATYQLESLEGKNTPWIEVLQQGAMSFISGRGLTIILMILAAVSVWLFMRGVLWLIRKRSRESGDRSTKTYYRLAAYAYRLLTAILIGVGVMMVLYLRQDLLLLAIMVVIFVGAALALKNLLPKYVAEGRLLLNMGGVREKERVIYNGIPWQVSNINMYSRLVNPEIRGAIRLPISHMHEMLSRPSIEEAWFPSSEGDWVLIDESPHQVISQTADMIELKDLNDVHCFVPSAEYYAAGHRNLTRTEVFRIAVRFGIDYATQAENVADIEAAFKQALEASIEGTPYAEHLSSVSVDFDSAGDSSLNYLMLARFEPAAAQYYNRIRRRIQRACVMACNEHGWGIPFPQLSVHLPENDEQTKEDE